VVAVLPRRIYVGIGLVLTHPRFHPVHRRLYRWSGGRGIVGRALGMDMILVTMTGRRTGESRTVPLGAVRRGEDWTLVGSNAGKPTTPAWVHNLRSNGDTEVEARGVRAPFVAHEATGTEYDELWRLVVAAYPGYAVYRARTDRPIALFVLEPRV
jgi:deazaflavin-dependent oxidoreductase (nitroreductase family)